jgi:hypothetical protein
LWRPIAKMLRVFWQGEKIFIDEANCLQMRAAKV